MKVTWTQPGMCVLICSSSELILLREAMGDLERKRRDALPTVKPEAVITYKGSIAAISYLADQLYSGS